MADIANPASTQAAKNAGRLGETATAAAAMTPTSDPAVITDRGPWLSMRRPTHTPATAAMSWATVNAATSRVTGQPSSALMEVTRTGNA